MQKSKLRKLANFPFNLFFAKKTDLKVLLRFFEQKYKDVLDKVKNLYTDNR